MLEERDDDNTQQTAEIQRAAAKFSRAFSREKFEASIQVPEAIRQAAMEVGGLALLFSRHGPEEKDTAYLQDAKEVVDLLAKGSEKDPGELIDALGRSLAFVSVSGEERIRMAGEVAGVVDNAISRFPKNHSLYPKLAPAATNEERVARAHAFYGILSASAEQLGEVYRSSPQEFGVRIAPAVVRAYGNAAEIASKHPQPEIIEHLVKPVF